MDVQSLLAAIDFLPDSLHGGVRYLVYALLGVHALAFTYWLLRALLLPQPSRFGDKKKLQ